MRAMVLAMTLSGTSAALANVAVAQDLSSHGDLGRVAINLVVPRARFGLSGVGGGFVGVTEGGAAGLAPRIGVQLTDVVGLYLQVHGLAGRFSQSASGTRVAGFLFSEIMADFTIVDRLQLGLGPSLDFTWNCADDESLRDPCGNGEGRFGGNFRVALVLGDDASGPDERNGITISLEVHPTWFDPDINTMMLFGIGGELY